MAKLEVSDLTCAIGFPVNQIATHQSAHNFCADVSVPKSSFAMFALQVTSYSHAPLLERLEEKLGLTATEARELEVDTLRFLSLCGYQDQSTEMVHLAPPTKIDEAWHHFILFTKEYMKFCDTYFGCYVHHQPHTAAERAAGDGQRGRNTLAFAKSFFGKLSSNWTGLADCYSDCTGSSCHACAPSTNCQN